MIWAWIGAIAVGLSLGLFGSGGSILTVPVLVYLLHHDTKAAMAESLAIVGLIALAGGIRQALRGGVEWRSVIWFGVPGMVGASMGAFLAKFIPGAVLLVIFAGLMIAASYMMLRPQRETPPIDTRARKARSAWKVILDGLAVGMLTGMVGAGGGFLIVPALVILGGLALHRAVGTSLWIIALKSAIGFSTYLWVLYTSKRGDALGVVNWQVIGIFVLAGVIGSFAGVSVGERLNARHLRRAFGVFLIVMAGYVLYRQAPQVLPGLFKQHTTEKTVSLHSEPAQSESPLILGTGRSGAHPS